MTLGVLICPSGVPALAADLHVTGSIEGQEKIASPFQMVAPQLHLPNHKIIDLVRKSHVFCDRSAGVFAGDRERIIDCASNIESLISAGLSGDEFVKNILDDNASAVEAIIFRINDTNSKRSAITSSKINYSGLIGAHSTIGSGSEEFQRWLPDAIQHLEYYDKIINLKEFPYEVIDTFFSFMNSRLLFSSVRPWLRQRSDWGTFIEAVYFDNQDRTWKKLPNRIFVSIDAIRLIGNKFYFRWSPFCYLYVNTGKNTYFVCLNLDQKLCVGVRIKNPDFFAWKHEP